MNLLKIVLGALCGVSATGPMSAAMVLWHRRLPESDQYPLPPREITMKALQQTMGLSQVKPETRSALTWLAHFGYGGAAGAIYAAACRRSGGTSMLGLLFGLMVWTVSYFGLMPGVGALKPAGEHPTRRNLLMIGAHVVWGLTLAGLFRIFSSDIGRESAAFDTSMRPHRDASRISQSEDDRTKPILRILHPAS